MVLVDGLVEGFGTHSNAKLQSKGGGLHQCPVGPKLLRALWDKLGGGKELGPGRRV